jgi:hypothetical protein
MTKKTGEKEKTAEEKTAEEDTIRSVFGIDVERALEIRDLAGLTLTLMNESGEIGRNIDVVVEKLIALDKEAAVWEAMLFGFTLNIMFHSIHGG